jgi:tetratricopeptide (TPR) repeat protein/acyl carrier protein
MAPKLAVVGRGSTSFGARNEEEQGVSKLLGSGAGTAAGKRLQIGSAPVDSDGRRNEYNSLADDAAVAEKKREAAMLFSAAEKRMDKEDLDECVRAASGAVKLFRELGEAGKAGLADALRIVIIAQMVKAEELRAEPTEAVKTANTELSKFKNSGDKRGQASMLLSIAEVYADWKGKEKKEKYSEGCDKAKEALSLFKEVEDDKMTSMARTVKGFLCLRTYEVDEAQDDFKAAAESAKKAGDKKQQAKALRGSGFATMINGKYLEGVETASEALALFKDLGEAKWEATQSLTVVRWMLLAGQPKKALPVAEKALDLFQGLNMAKGWAGMALLAYSETVIALKDPKKAVKACKEAMPRLLSNADKKSQVFLHYAIAQANLAMDSPDKALKSLEEAQLLVKDLGDKIQEASLMHGFAAVHLKSNNIDKALETLREAVDIAEEANDKEETAAAQRVMSSLHARMPVGDGELALRAASAALDLSQSVGDKYGEAIDSLMVAVAQQMSDEQDKAVTAVTEAQEIFQELHDVRGEAMALELMAEIKLMDDKNEAALEAAEERLSIVRDLGDLRLEASSQHQVARLNLADANITEAERCCKEAMGLYQEAGDTVGELEAMVTLVQIYIGEAGEDKSSENFPRCMEMALKVATDALPLAAKTGSKSMKASVLYFKAMAQMYNEQFQTASQTLSDAETIFKNIDNTVGKARCMVLSANLQLINGAMDKALDTLDKALALARECGDSFAEYDTAQLIQVIQGRQQAQMAQFQQQMMPTPGEQQLMVPAGGGAAEEAAAAPASVAVAEPVGLDPAFVRKQLMAFTRDVCASDEELELDTPFMEAGMDSLSSVSLMSMVAKEFQMALSPSLVFDFPTIRAMEDHLVAESKDV